MKVYPLYGQGLCKFGKMAWPRMLEYEGNNTLAVLLPQFRGHEGVKIEVDMVLIIGNSG